MLFKAFTFVFSIIFTTNVFAVNGAGGLLLFDDGTVLIAEEHRRTRAGVHFKAISDFGGGQEKNETLFHTAAREIKEETGHYSFPQITLGVITNSPYVDKHHKGGCYREFLIRVHGKKPSITDIINNAKMAQKNLGNKAHVEKTEWMYVPAQHLLNAANTNNPLLPGMTVNLYGHFMGVLKKPETRKALQDLINFTNKAPAPLKVVAKPAPAKIIANPTPARVTAKPAPAMVIVKPAPARIIARRAQARIIAKRAPARVIAKRAPARIIANRAKSTIVAKRAPARVAAHRKFASRKGMFKRRAHR